MQATDRGAPRAVRLRGHHLTVKRILDVWRIDNDWWRPQPISRRYFLVELNNGLLQTLYQDLASGAWFMQHY